MLALTLLFAFGSLRDEPATAQEASGRRLDGGGESALRRGNQQPVELVPGALPSRMARMRLRLGDKLRPESQDLLVAPPSLTHPPPRLGETLIFGSDDRVQVEDTSAFPNAAVVFVDSTFPSGARLGYSGFLISPYSVLTVAVALFDPLEGGFAEEVRIVPGQDQDTRGGTIVEPFGGQNAVEIQVPQAWIDQQTPSLNVGAAFVARAFDGIDEALTIGYDLTPLSGVTIAGYDEAASGGQVSFGQWTRSGNLIGVDNLYFDHRLDVDAGTAGAPAWILGGDDKPRVFGIDCCVSEDESANAGIRFTARNRALLENWQAVRPIPADAVPLELGQGDRFRVVAAWTNAQGTEGLATPVEITQDTGYFWFFDDANIELIVKVLGACSVNERYWVFAAGLTDVEVQIEVEDTQLGLVRRYANPSGTAFAPIQDTAAFATCP